MGAVGWGGVGWVKRECDLSVVGGWVGDRSTKTDNGIQPVFMNVHIMGERETARTGGREDGRGGEGLHGHVCMHACIMLIDVRSQESYHTNRSLLEDSCVCA